MFLVLGWLLRNDPAVQWVFPVVGPLILILSGSFHHLTVKDEGDRLNRGIEMDILEKSPAHFFNVFPGTARNNPPLGAVVDI